MKLRTTSSNRAGGVGAPADPNRASSLDFFRYASLCRVSKHRCCSCGAPIRRRGARRVALCPVCDAATEFRYRVLFSASLAFTLPPPPLVFPFGGWCAMLDLLKFLIYLYYTLRTERCQHLSMKSERFFRWCLSFRSDARRKHYVRTNSKNRGGRKGEGAHI